MGSAFAARLAGPHAAPTATSIIVTTFAASVNGFSGRDVHQHHSHHPRRRQSAEHADANPDRREHRALAEHQAEQPRRLGAQRSPNSKFSHTLRDHDAHDAVKSDERPLGLGARPHVDREPHVRVDGAIAAERSRSHAGERQQVTLAWVDPRRI